MTRVARRRQPSGTARRLTGVRLLVCLTALLALLTACASSGAGSSGGGTATPTGDSPDPAAGGGISQADNDLQVSYDRGDGAEPETWTLTCAGLVEGSHPDAEAACAHLATVDDPFAPLPTDLVCTEQYGGPQTARILGRWDGEAVDLEVSRTDGCRISQWDALVPLLPGV